MVLLQSVGQPHDLRHSHIASEWYHTSQCIASNEPQVTSPRPVVAHNAATLQSAVRDLIRPDHMIQPSQYLSFKPANAGVLLALTATFLSLDNGLLLLEEPELSLHASVVKRVASLIYRVLRPSKRQVLISTHSADLLSDRGIGGEETLLLTPSVEGTKVVQASSLREVRALLESGFSVAEAALQHTEPQEIRRLELFP